MNELAKFLILSNDDLETAQLLCDCGRYRSAISRAYRIIRQIESSASSALR